MYSRNSYYDNTSDIYKDALKSVKRTTRVILAAATGDKLTQAKLSDDSLIGNSQGENCHTKDLL